MNEKKNARPGLATRERAVAKQHGNLIKQSVATLVVCGLLYFFGSFGMYWLLQALGRLP